ncbi:MAG: pyridoxal-phosphate dependent enzyme, partial [Muribaculaceae bacterium]|nr:pyridoxal-phosphate dependent enzyme [Muribaculaceae bacterium]
MKPERNYPESAFETNVLQPDENGFYGADRRFGGQYVPDGLKKNLDEVYAAFTEAVADPAFMAEFEQLLRDYVGRPSALYHARRLSEKYGATILLKREDLNHTGAHKINNALGLGLLARRMGKRRIIAETGAGQHGVAAATVAALLGLECTVYMGAVDVERQRPNVERMKMLGADVVAVTDGGATLQDAVNAALNAWVEQRDDTFYLIGSAVGPHPFPRIVTFFQSVISRELLDQVPALTGRATPDMVIACVGGGSNAGGAFYHFVDRPEVKLVAVEAAGRTRYR